MGKITKNQKKYHEQSERELENFCANNKAYNRKFEILSFIKATSPLSEVSRLSIWDFIKYKTTGKSIHILRKIFWSNVLPSRRTDIQLWILCKNGKYGSTEKDGGLREGELGWMTESQLFEDGHIIYAVKRNSDGELFKIGDTVRYSKKSNTWHDQSFKILHFGFAHKTNQDMPTCYGFDEKSQLPNAATLGYVTIEKRS